MIDGQETFPTLAHLSLCGKQIFGRSFVAQLRIWCDVAQAIKICGLIFREAAD